MKSKGTLIFLPPSQFEAAGVRLRKEDEHYLRKVLRKKEEDHFVALDAQGKAWLCGLGPSALASKLDDYPAVAPLNLHLRVGLALCKGSRFEGAIEKLAELGVSEVIPITTERSERKVPSAAKLERCREIALAGSALAGRLIPLKVRTPTSFHALLDGAVEDLCCCHPGGREASEYFAQERKRLLLLIGPEGGFSPEEIVALEGRADRVDLGPLNLRVETAAVAAASLALNLCPRP